MQRFSRSVVPNGKRVKDQTFAFDRIFDENTTQGDVYEATTRNLLDSVLDGYNATVFAYGATGCGKTHTITGTAQQPGIIFMTMQELFERISERSDEKVTELSLSYLEIYNETIRDLLVPGGNTVGPKGGLMLREDANQAVSVAGLTSHHPQNVQEVMDMIMRGNEYRTMSPTEANATSSRSHAVLQINVSQKDRNADVNEPHTMATLSIIDLAGSERASATKNRGDRLMEGANINKSLLALGSCINALCDPRKRNHVPYRNSKLTRLLKFSLGGNCKTVMIVCVSPSSQHFDETQNTLRYANRAKNIQTKVTRNVFNVNRHVKDFLVKIDEQMALINELKAQQKDYETAAFAKFKKQAEKRDGIVREGTARIRNAFDHSAPERQEKTNNMRKLRQIERRISVLSSWIAAFDGVCESREDDDALRNLQAMRKTAQGILVELETSRQHMHQRLAKTNWERAVNSALENGLRQLKEAGGQDELDAAHLTREVELLRANAERETLTAVDLQEKGGDAATVQVLLQAHFETISAIETITDLTEEEAVNAAKTILSRILTSCSSAASHVVKPDGSIAPVEAFPPTRAGTPKRKKQTAGSTPMKPYNLALAVATHASSSPYKASPKRRKFPGAKKGVQFTPKKKSPVKGLKRGVRWRDDTEDGKLAEYQKTPQKLYTPEAPSVEPVMSPSQPLPPPTVDSDAINSSPIPIPPEPSSNGAATKSNRFQSGFLSKKRTKGSPLPPQITSFSSDSDHSPLGDMDPSKTMNRTSLSTMTLPSPDETPANSSSENEMPRSDAMKIQTAMRRASTARTSMGGAGGGSSSASRTHRRRSPNASNLASSPPNENQIFSASHAKRMVRSEKENEWRNNVLGPRTTPVMKSGGGSGPSRRTTLTTLGDGKVRDSFAGMGSSAAGGRGSFAGGKGAWR